VTVLDSSAVVDYLLGTGVAREAGALFEREAPLAAPDVLVFEVLAVIRRHTLAGALQAERAQAALDDLGDISLELFPSMPLRLRAWEMRHNLAAADALFVALAEQLDEPLATSDRGLANAVREQSGIRVLVFRGAG